MKKIISFILAAVMVISLAACGKETVDVTQVDTSAVQEAPATTTTTSSSTTTSTETTEPAKKIFYTYLSMEATTLNGMATVSSENDTPISFCSAYLWRQVPNADGTGFEFIPDLASEMPIEIDDHTWQVKLREEACWHNGEKITADDWMFTFKTLIDPIAVQPMAGFFGDNNIVIENATEYNLQGDSNTVAWEDVGVKKIDDYTLEFKVVDPVTVNDFCTHFTLRCLTPVYEPLYTANMTSGGIESSYGSSLDKWMGCGPYFFDTWTYDSIHIYEKNPDYWLSDYFNYDEVQVRIVPDANSLVELFESGQLDSFSPDANYISSYLDDPRMVSYPSTMVYHYDINYLNENNPLHASMNYRQAIYCAIDRETVAAEMWGYMEPAATYVNGMAGILSENGEIYRESSYGKEVYEYIKETYGDEWGYNPELAKEYMMKAFEESGLNWDTDVVTLQFLNWNGYPADSKMIEFFMEQFPIIFDGRIEIEPNVIPETMCMDYIVDNVNDWDICLQDWTRGLCRTLPYQCMYYFTEAYSAHPNNFFPEEFENQWAYCESIKTGPYDEVQAATRDLEIANLETMMVVPLVQAVNYTLFAENLVLPVNTYIPGFGWGTMFGDKTVE